MKLSWVCLLALISRILVSSASISTLSIVSEAPVIPVASAAMLATPASLPEIDRAIANGEIDKAIGQLEAMRSQAKQNKDSALEAKVMSRLQFAYYCQGATSKSLGIAPSLSDVLYPLANRDRSNQEVVAAIADHLIWYLYAAVEHGNRDYTDNVIKELLENIDRAKDSSARARFYLGLAYAYHLKGNTALFDKYRQKLDLVYPKIDKLKTNEDTQLIFALIKFTGATSSSQKDYQSKIDRIAAIQKKYENSVPIIKAFSQLNIAVIHFEVKNYGKALAILGDNERNLKTLPGLVRYLTLNYLGDIASKQKRYTQANKYYLSLAKESDLLIKNNCRECMPVLLFSSIYSKLTKIKYLLGQPLSKQEINSLIYTSSDISILGNYEFLKKNFMDRFEDGIIAQKSLISQGLIWDAFAASEYARAQLSRISIGYKMSVIGDAQVERGMDISKHPFKDVMFPNSVWNLASIFQSQNTVQINEKYGDRIHKIFGNGRTTIVEYAYNFVEKKPTEIYAYVLKPERDIKKMQPILRCIPLDSSLASDICKAHVNPTNSLPAQERTSINKLGLKEYIRRNLGNVKNCRRGEISRQNGCSSQTGKDTKKTYKSLQALHQLLIAPIADLLPTNEYEKVIFIPQGDLFSIPFVALQDRQGKYLIEKHTISLAPSLMLLGKATDLYLEESRAQAKGVLVVGNPTMSKELSLSPLPAAEVEANTIANIYGIKPLIGDRATKESVLKQLTGARIVHLATHGLLNDSNSLNNSIALAPTPTDSKGTLLAREIPTNKAELVILSACDSAKGEITTDGLGGFATQLILAGVPSQILTLWAVNDNSTAEIMIDFHREFRSGNSKTHALRFAMLKAIQNKQHPEYAEPYYWAPFVLMGGTQ
jgi:CHAT domain-containing protein